MVQNYLTCDSASSGRGPWAQLCLQLYPRATGPGAPAGPGCVAVRPSTERPPHARGLLGASWVDGAVGAFVLRARWASATGRGRACRGVRRARCSRSPLRCAGGVS